MIVSNFASGGLSRTGKMVGVAALVVVALGGLVYSLTSYGQGDEITPVTEADGNATMRKLTCSKCGYEEEVTSADYNERMKERSDPNQWLECPKCHENAVQRASSGTPFGSPAPPDSTTVEMPNNDAEKQPDPEAPAVPEIKNRTMSPGAAAP